MKLLASLAFFALGAIFTATCHAQERTEPACQNEVWSLDDLLGRLAAPEVYAGTGKPPGRLIMLGPFTDSRFNDGNWEKWALTAYYRNSTTSPVFGFRSTVRYTTQLHYMFNRVTRRAAQIKFATTVEQGCVGEEIVDNPKLSAKSGDRQCRGSYSEKYIPSYVRTTVWTEVAADGVPATMRGESKLVDQGGSWLRERDDCNGK